jgi:GNAT superfamily N-acetyltransferase
MIWRQGEYFITDDPRQANLDAIYRWLSTSYWAADRSKATIQQSLAHSICFSMYKGETPVGFARAVTDYATMAWIGDVIIDPAYRGQGLGKWLMATIVADERLQPLALILSTRDAHTLYEKYGFVREPEGFLRRKRPKTLPVENRI